ncbi:MAG: HAMP domain-containing histidine kinase [Deltaproteobacteria bacterium]|nr:HAMP domain-containing histidine kinase [Deltaproteobacteria bacterium]
MAERRMRGRPEPPRLVRPGRVAGALWLAAFAVGAGSAGAIVFAAELFGRGTYLARVAELAALLGLAGGLVAAFVVLRVDLWPVVRRLSDAHLRGDAAHAAQVGTLAGRLAAYPRRYGRILAIVLLAVCPAALLLASWLSGDLVRWFRPLWPVALLAAPLAAGAAQLAFRFALGPFLARLPAPPSAASYRASLATVLGVMLVVPVAAASLFGLLYLAFDGVHHDQTFWRASHERAATALAAADGIAMSAALEASTDPRAPGVAVVPVCDRDVPRLAALSCETALGAVPDRPAGSWVDPARNVVYAAALLPPAPGGRPGAVVVWSPRPSPAGAPSWLLVAILVTLGAVYLGGFVLGRRTGGHLRVLADAVARVGERSAPSATASPPSAVREIARLQAATIAMADRAASMRVDEETALAALDEAQRMRTQFLASVSHDLKGPLNAILGFSELLLRGVEGALAPKQRDDVRLIHHGGEDLLAIINGILDSAKLEAGRVELHHEWTPSVELISQAASHARTLLGDKDVTLQTQLQAGLPPVWVDPHRLGQALAAIVSNAVKFTDCGVINVRARVETSEAGRALRVDVVDSGRGISDEDRSRIFQIFEQADSSTRRTVGGTGLGLFIARAMIELHGGSLSFESQVGKGSTFTIRLPLPDEPPGAAPDGAA